jgi:hypothetical protein
MEHIRYFAELVAALTVAIAFPFLIVVLLRSRKIPECFSCGAMKMRPSRVDGLWDRFLAAFQILPYRCEGCRERFHAVRILGDSRKPSPAQPVVQPVQRRRVITVAFRFRNGLLNRVAIRVHDPRPETASATPAILQA